MKIRNVLLAAAVVFQMAAVFAQPRKSYPVPVKTPEVQRLLEQRRLWTPSAREALPQSVDNSVSEHFPAIFNQIGGSCAQSSGIRYMFTYEMNRCLGRKATAPDNVFSYFYTWNFLNNGIDEGGWSEQGLNIARSTGVMNLADFPDQTSAYQFRWQSGYDKYIRAMHYRVDEILSMPVTSEAEIEVVKSYLAQGGVVTYSSYSSDWKMNDYYDGPSQTGYRSLLTRLATTGAHAMTIVGYDDTVEFTPEGGEPTTGAFIVVNSWGSYWHDNGRFYLPYYFFLQKYADGNMLSDDVTGITVKYHEPKIIFKVGLTYTSRNDLAFALGVANKPYAEIPTVKVSTTTVSNQGGDNNMQGAYESADMEIAFDFTDYLSQVEAMSEPKFFLTVTRSNRGKTLGSGRVTYFSVLDLRDENAPKEYVCNTLGSSELALGENVFYVATTPATTTSASEVKWNDNLYRPYSYPFVFRTASGKYSKVQFTDYDRKTGKVTLRYLYQGNGTTDIANVEE